MSWQTASRDGSLLRQLTSESCVCHLLLTPFVPLPYKPPAPEHGVSERTKTVSTEPQDDKKDETPPGTDRPRGILTESDREWLSGEKEFESRAGLHKARNRVKDRLTHATHDFQYLLTWPEDQRREVFEVEKEGTAAYRQYSLDDEIGESVTDAVAFYLRTAGDAAFGTEELLEAAFVEAQPDVAEAKVAVDLRDSAGDVIRTFHIEDGQIIHQESAPGALDSAPETDERGNEERSSEDVGVLEDAYRSVAAAGKQVASILIQVAFYVYIVAFGYIMYQEYGMAATVGMFTAIGAIVWLLGLVSSWIRGLSEKDDATLMDGVWGALGREETGEDEDDGADGRRTTQEPA